MGIWKDSFIPHAGNDYTPHVLQRLAALLMAVMVLLTFAVANMQSMLWIGSEWMVSTILPAVVVQETNKERSVSALTPLERNTVLDYAATLKARHMAQNSYFSHYSPDGVSPWYWFGVANYNFLHAGENLAVHFKDSSQLVDAWMDSPTHRANILNGQYEEIGIGVAEGEYEGYETIFVVQLFGTPTAAATPNILGINDAEPEPSTTSDENTAVAAATETTSVVEAEAAAEPVASEQVSGDEVVIEETSERRQEPVLVGTEETVVTAEPFDETATTSVASEAAPPAVADSFLATSAVPIAAIDKDTSTTAGVTPSTLATLATKPAKVMETIYIALAFFVLLALFLSIMIEVRRQRPVQIAYALCLLTLMGGMWWLHTSLTNTVIIS